MDPRWKYVSFTKILPVLFVISIIASLASIYLVLHVIPMLYPDDSGAWAPGDQHKGQVQLAVFATLTLLMLVSYVRAILVHPGTVPERSPDGSVEWIVRKYSPATDADIFKADGDQPFLREAKRNGERRRCKYCAEAKRAVVQYKPDRTHHCKLCDMCILKMDHHCPWIYNCVGFHNHKYFFLTVLYAALDTHFIFFSMWESAEAAVYTEMTLPVRFWLIFAQTITAVLGFVVTLFLYFHIYLMYKGMTTIEFCEKQRTRGFVFNYDRGFWGNFEAVLGPVALLYLLPLSPPSGDGLTYDFDPRRGELSSDDGSHEERSPIAKALVADDA